MTALLGVACHAGSTLIYPGLTPAGLVCQQCGAAARRRAAASMRMRPRRDSP